MSRSCSIDIEARGGVTTVAITGVIDEDADLSFLRGLHGDIRIDLSELRRINSFGVKSWMEAVRSRADDARVELVACPPPFVDQLNILDGFLGDTRVTSFLAPYICDHCDVEVDQLVEVETCRAQGLRLPPGGPCPTCQRPMEANEVESLYLRFLRE